MPGVSLTFDPARRRHGGTAGGESCRAPLKPPVYTRTPGASPGEEGAPGWDFFLRDRLSFWAALKRKNRRDTKDQSELNMRKTSDEDVRGSPCVFYPPVMMPRRFLRCSLNSLLVKLGHGQIRQNISNRKRRRVGSMWELKRLKLRSDIIRGEQSPCTSPPLHPSILLTESNERTERVITAREKDGRVEPEGKSRVYGTVTFITNKQRCKVNVCVGTLLTFQISPSFYLSLFCCAPHHHIHLETACDGGRCVDDPVCKPVFTGTKITWRRHHRHLTLINSIRSLTYRKCWVSSGSLQELVSEPESGFYRCVTGTCWKKIRTHSAHRAPL